MTKKKIIVPAILLFILGIAFVVLFYPHLRVIKNIISYTENVVSTTEMRNFYLSDGDEKLLINNAIKQNYQIRFDGKVEHFETLYIGKGDNRYCSSFLKLTKDSIYAYIKTGSIRQQLATKHNLLLNNDLLIIIDQKLDSARILLTNKTDTFKISSKFIGMDNPFIRSVGSKINVNDFAFTSNDYKNEVWIFGDSYMSCSNPARWPYWIYNDSLNFLCDGLPGGKSIHSYDFLRTALTISKPKYLVWCLGMNDGSDKYIANVSWLIYTEKVKEVCKENGITLIFGIVPTCPKVFNKYKNEYIRKSGYRYIDFEKALFDENGNWKSGYCADGVHPTIDGAKAMAEQFLKDFPEILQYEEN
jgi:hypothetical protein